MASIDEVLAQLKAVNERLIDLQSGRINPDRMALVAGLSDMDVRLGTVTAGEFRTGNGQPPGSDFTGVRMAYPPMVYGGENWSVAGVANDILQFGLNADDGKGYFGGGNVILDEDGISINAGLDGISAPNAVTWYDPATNYNTLYLGSWVGKIPGVNAGVTTSYLTVQNERADFTYDIETNLDISCWAIEDDVHGTDSESDAYIREWMRCTIADINTVEARVHWMGHTQRYSDHAQGLAWFMTFLVGSTYPGGRIYFNYDLNAHGYDMDVVFQADDDSPLVFMDASEGRVGIGDAFPGEKLDVAGNINATGVVKIDDVQVVGNRVVDARCDDAIDSGDATTDGVIDALRDCLLAHGLLSAS